MKTLASFAFILLASAFSLLAQNGPSGGVQIQQTGGTPSGTCGNTQMRLKTPTGALYSCQSGVWAQVGGGGGGTCASLAGDVNGYTVSSSTTGDLTGISNPFTSTGTGDLSLNATAGAGALLRSTGYPGIFPNGTTTDYLDIGAAQHQTAAAAQINALFGQ